MFSTASNKPADVSRSVSYKGPCDIEACFFWVTFVFSRVDEAGPNVASWHAAWIRERGTRWKTRRVRFASGAVGSSCAPRTFASLLLVPSCGEPASVRERYGVVHIGRLEGKASLLGLDFIGFRSQYYFMPRHASPQAKHLAGKLPSSSLRKVQRSRLCSLDFAAFTLRHRLLASGSRWGQVCFAPVSKQNKRKA